MTITCIITGCWIYETHPHPLYNTASIYYSTIRQTTTTDGKIWNRFMLWFIWVNCLWNIGLSDTYQFYEKSFIIIYYIDFYRFRVTNAKALNTLYKFHLKYISMYMSVTTHYIYKFRSCIFRPGTFLYKKTIQFLSLIVIINYFPDV